MRSGNAGIPSATIHAKNKRLKTSERSISIGERSAGLETSPYASVGGVAAPAHDEVGEGMAHACGDVLVVLEHDQAGAARPAPPVVLTEAGGEHGVRDDT